MVYNPAFTATDTSTLDRLRAQAGPQQTPYERQMAEYEAAMTAEDQRNQAEGRTSYDRLVRQNQDYTQRRTQADSEIKAARDEAYGLARGAASRRNPVDDQLLEMMRNRAGQGGTDPETLRLLRNQASTGVGGTPYDATTIQSLMTQASDAAAQAQLNAKGRINGNATDPSVMAANNEADARRSQAVQQAQLGINTQANIANTQAGQSAFALTGNAIGRLADYQRMSNSDQAGNLNQLANQNRYMNDDRNANEQRLISMLSNERRTVQSDPGIPTYEEYARANGYGPRAILPPVQQAQRQPINSGTILRTGGNSGDTLASQANRFAGNQVQSYQPGKVVTGMNKVDAASPAKPAAPTNTVGPMAGGYQTAQQPQPQYNFGVYKPMAQKNPYNTNLLPKNF